MEVAAASILGVGALKLKPTRDVVEPTRGAGDIFNESSDEEDQGGFPAEKREKQVILLLHCLSGQARY